MSSTVLDFISLLNLYLLNYVIVDWCSVLKMWFFFTAMTSSGGQPWIVDIPERMSWPTCESTVAARGHPGRMRSSGRLRAKDRTPTSKKVGSDSGSATLLHRTVNILFLWDPKYDYDYDYNYDYDYATMTMRLWLCLRLWLCDYATMRLCD